MTTKEKILEAALSLFNELGTDVSSLRVIAKEVGISHGNLAYHFPNTDVIIHQLYLDLVQELDEQIHSAMDQAIDLASLFELGWLNFNILQKYRFLLLDFVRIMRRIDAIKAHFRTLTELRKQQFHFMIDSLIQRGLLREERFEGGYQRLIGRLFILGDHWIPHSEIHFGGEDAERLQRSFVLFISQFEPYFTEEGRLEYLQEIDRFIVEKGMEPRLFK
ncbi:MAG: TetR family transcriptional regulator [Phaeodactylibacter sp.]|nr:TetR family transcriptional regulator [Phaeodactylibacter sp.]